jgi:ribosomal protein L12E/L44/L45/RPP1/RPP2
MWIELVKALPVIIKLISSIISALEGDKLKKKIEEINVAVMAASNATTQEDLEYAAKKFATIMANRSAKL